MNQGYMEMTLPNGRVMTLGQPGAEIKATIQAASSHDELKPYAEILGTKLALNKDILTFLLPFAMKGNYERYLSDATIYMSFLGTIVMGWQWLKIALVAQEALKNSKGKYAAEFYESQIHTMKFFFKYEMPKTDSFAATIKSNDELNIVSDKELIF